MTMKDGMPCQVTVARAPGSPAPAVATSVSVPEVVLE